MLGSGPSDDGSNPSGATMEMKFKIEHDFTFICTESESGGYFSAVNEVPGAMSQGATLDELKINLADAVKSIFASYNVE